jgi:hypothetical protein
MDAKLSETEHGCEFSRQVGMNIFEEMNFHLAKNIIYNFLLFFRKAIKLLKEFLILIFGLEFSLE